jgi:hypothetical protein
MFTKRVGFFVLALASYLANLELLSGGGKKKSRFKPVRPLTTATKTRTPTATPDVFPCTALSAPVRPTAVLGDEGPLVPWDERPQLSSRPVFGPMVAVAEQQGSAAVHFSPLPAAVEEALRRQFYGFKSWLDARGIVLVAGLRVAPTTAVLLLESADGQQFELIVDASGMLQPNVPAISQSVGPLLEGAAAAPIRTEVDEDKFEKFSSDDDGDSERSMFSVNSEDGLAGKDTAHGFDVLSAQSFAPEAFALVPYVAPPPVVPALSQLLSATGSGLTLQTEGGQVVLKSQQGQIFATTKRVIINGRNVTIFFPTEAGLAAFGAVTATGLASAGRATAKGLGICARLGIQGARLGLQGAQVVAATGWHGLKVGLVLSANGLTAAHLAAEALEGFVARN